MKILFTGASGFVGKEILPYLTDNHSVITIGRRSSDIIYDFGSIVKNLPEVDLLIHCAGLAHLNSTDKSDLSLFQKVNVDYSKNLLESIKVSNCNLKYAVLISSVSVYGMEEGIMLDENTDLNANDAYGISKLDCEYAFINWAKEMNIVLTILRLPLVIGVNPPGSLGTMINAIRKGFYFNINGGNARKSMVLASDVGKIIIKVSKIGGVFNLTDGYHPSFKEISYLIAGQIGRKKLMNIPLPLAKIFAYIGELIGAKAPINLKKIRKINNTLTFDDTKARNTFGWNPNTVLAENKLYI